MGKRVTFSEGAEIVGVPINTISKWFSQGLFKNVDIDRNSPGGPTYLLKVEELFAIKDALEAEYKGEEMARQEIAAAQEKKNKEKAEDVLMQKRKLSLVKSNVKDRKPENIVDRSSNTGKEIVLKIQEDTAAGLINMLIGYLNNFEQKFLQHLEEQADKNMLKYNTMAIEHLDTLKEMSSKMETVVDALLKMPQKVTEDTVKVVSEIKEMIPEMKNFGDAKGTNEKLDAFCKKLDKLSEEIKDTKWAVVKLARENNKVNKKASSKRISMPTFGIPGLVMGIGKMFKMGK